MAVAPVAAASVASVLLALAGSDDGCAGSSTAAGSSRAAGSSSPTSSDADEGDAEARDECGDDEGELDDGGAEHRGGDDFDDDVSVEELSPREVFLPPDGSEEEDEEEEEGEEESEESDGSEAGAECLLMNATAPAAIVAQIPQEEAEQNEEEDEDGDEDEDEEEEDEPKAKADALPHVEVALAEGGAGLEQEVDQQAAQEAASEKPPKKKRKKKKKKRKGTKDVVEEAPKAPKRPGVPRFPHPSAPAAQELQLGVFASTAPMATERAPVLAAKDRISKHLFKGRFAKKPAPFCPDGTDAEGAQTDAGEVTEAEHAQGLPTWASHAAQRTQSFDGAAVLQAQLGLDGLLRGRSAGDEVGTKKKRRRAKSEAPAPNSAGGGGASSSTVALGMGLSIVGMASKPQVARASSHGPVKRSATAHEKASHEDDFDPSLASLYFSYSTMKGPDGQKVPLKNRNVVIKTLHELNSKIATPICRFFGLRYNFFSEQHPQANKAGNTRKEPLILRKKNAEGEETEEIRHMTTIRLRLRVHPKKGNPQSDFIAKGTQLAVLLHELCHLRHMNHGKDFMLLLRDIYAQARKIGVFDPCWENELPSSFRWEKEIYHAAGEMPDEELLTIFAEERARQMAKQVEEEAAKAAENPDAATVATAAGADASVTAASAAGEATPGAEASPPAAPAAEPSSEAAEVPAPPVPAAVRRDATAAGYEAGEDCGCAVQGLGGGLGLVRAFGGAACCIPADDDSNDRGDGTFVEIDTGIPTELLQMALGAEAAGREVAANVARGLASSASASTLRLPPIASAAAKPPRMPSRTSSQSEVPTLPPIGC